MKSRRAALKAMTSTCGFKTRIPLLRLRVTRSKALELE